MKHRHAVDKLAKMLAYVLGRQPDEFGLVPDDDGYVKTKDLLKALGEETGWRHVRMSHIREVIHTHRPAVVETAGNRIRAVDRSRLGIPQTADHFPTLLYHAIRQRAHANVVQRGIQGASAGGRIVLAADMEMARRLGRRIDASPVILTVNTQQAENQGVRLWSAGGPLYLADRLPPGCFQAPPVPKTTIAAKPSAKPDPPPSAKTSGSFLLEADKLMPPPSPSGKAARMRKNSWKQHRKRNHRGGTKGWPE